MNGKDNSKYLTLKETAILTKTAYATVKRDIENGILSAYHIGRKYFVKKEDAEKYLEIKRPLKNIDGYTIQELMKIIPLSYAFIINLIQDKKLEAVKVGRRYIIPKDKFEAFIEERKTMEE